MFTSRGLPICRVLGECLLISSLPGKSFEMYFDIKFTRQGFENACLHREACRDTENSR